MQPLPRYWIKSADKIICQVTSKPGSVKVSEASSGTHWALRKPGDTATLTRCCSLFPETPSQVRTWETNRAASSGTHFTCGPSAFVCSVLQHQRKRKWAQCVCISVHAPTHTQTPCNWAEQKTKSCSILAEDDVQRHNTEEAEQRHRRTVRCELSSQKSQQSIQ